MSTLAEINASLQKLKPTNQFQTLTQEWIAVATEGLDPTSPPVTETRACYVTTQPTDAALLALLPTLKAASYNTVKCPAGYTSSLAWMAVNGMTGWVSPATWQSGGGWDQSQAQIVSAMQAAWKACPAASRTSRTSPRSVTRVSPPRSSRCRLPWPPPSLASSQ